LSAPGERTIAAAPWRKKSLMATRRQRRVTRGERWRARGYIQLACLLPPRVRGSGNARIGAEASAWHRDQADLRCAGEHGWVSRAHRSSLAARHQKETRGSGCMAHAARAARSNQATVLREVLRRPAPRAAPRRRPHPQCDPRAHPAPHERPQPTLTGTEWRRASRRCGAPVSRAWRRAFFSSGESASGVQTCPASSNCW